MNWQIPQIQSDSSKFFHVGSERCLIEEEKIVEAKEIVKEIDEMKYTRKDVIIWADDKRLDGYGFRVWGDCTPMAVLNKANQDKEKHFIGELLSTEEGDEPFKVLNDRDDNPVLYPCVIIEKEPQKKLVPFDFSLKEDRDALMGKRICNDGIDLTVTSFMHCLVYPDKNIVWTAENWDGDWLFEHFVFADGPNKDKPVGKEVEE